jgi:hypothetical protein
LVYEIEGRIFDFTSDRVTEQELRRCLRPLAPSWWDAVDATLAVPITPKPKKASKAKRSAPKLGATVEVAAAGT